MKYTFDEVMIVTEGEYLRMNMLPDIKSSAFLEWKKSMVKFVDEISRHEYASIEDLRKEVRIKIKNDMEEVIDEWLGIFSV